MKFAELPIGGIFARSMQIGSTFIKIHPVEQWNAIHLQRGAAHAFSDRAEIIRLADTFRTYVADLQDNTNYY